MTTVRAGAPPYVLVPSKQQEMPDLAVCHPPFFRLLEERIQLPCMNNLGRTLSDSEKRCGGWNRAVGSWQKLPVPRRHPDSGSNRVRRARRNVTGKLRRRAENGWVRSKN